MESESTSSLKSLVDKNKTLCLAGGAAVLLAVAVAVLGGRLASVLGLLALVGGAVFAATTRGSPKPAEEAEPAPAAPAKEEAEAETEAPKAAAAPASPAGRPRPQLQRTARSKLIAGFEDGSVKLADVLPAAAASTLARRNEKAEKQATLGRSAAQALQRNRVMNETVATERAYVAYLATLREVFIEPLRAAHILDEQQMRDVFGFVEVIEGINRTVVLEKLEQWAPDGPLTPGDVFDAFTSQAGYLQSYSSYVNNFDDSRTRLAELQESVKPFAEFLEVCMPISLLLYTHTYVTKHDCVLHKQTKTSTEGATQPALRWPDARGVSHHARPAAPCLFPLFLLPLPSSGTHGLTVRTHTHTHHRGTCC